MMYCCGCGIPFRGWGVMPSISCQCGSTSWRGTAQLPSKETYEALKEPEQMSNAELQREIGRLQAELIRRVCGDPVAGVGLSLPNGVFHVKQEPRT